jgi:hypothetical protein
MDTEVPTAKYHMERASTAISAFFRYPVSNTNTL